MEAPRERHADREELVRVLMALASPTRLLILDRLARPAFAPDLARELEISRQALAKHLEALTGVGLVVARTSHRGTHPATEYVANPGALFVFKEGVQALARLEDGSVLPSVRTRLGGEPRADDPYSGPGLLLVHGDAPGRWFPLTTGTAWVLGRDARDDVPIPYDPFASARHALLRREGSRWTLTDLNSTNGTLVNFRPLPPGGSRAVSPGDLITIGHSQLLLRDGS